MALPSFSMRSASMLSSSAVAAILPTSVLAHAGHDHLNLMERLLHHPWELLGLIVTVCAGGALWLRHRSRK